MQNTSGMWSRGAGVVFGVLLVLFGVFLLAVNTFGMQLPFDLGQLGWPVFVIAPGVALLLIGLITSGEAGLGLTTAGGIVTTVGGILAYQWTTDHWSSWAYAWALIAPTSVGAALLLWGIFHRRGDLVRQGLSGLGFGLVIFIIGFAFFEGVLHIGGERGLAPLGRQALPVALIAAGVLVIVSRLWPRKRREWVGRAGWPGQQPPPSAPSPSNPSPSAPFGPFAPSVSMGGPPSEPPPTATVTGERPPG